ncbi:hypothetical protein FIU83_13015 [Halomonas sp. THAF5a]|uniref:CRISPR system precrRNA processing endoribonuclease RAMP protein Cas6 n=1 Tax=Halomonas sp. THAF5a TaxID=2587844 RepID=UPI001268946D|nr:CRISPR system precrRNA processing endoribonuclease RAMP protein Cas6 [Halomonas sp. THAF5a]QFU02557.1 hypothetical protein FIU83_13015 [Halomonas sp. THAF5a]
MRVMEATAGQQLDTAVSAGLPMGLYRLQTVAEQPIHLPGFAGATLRGALGHALRELSCMTGMASCEGCPLLRSCRYPALFEPKALGTASPGHPTPPPPYILRSPVTRPHTLRPGAQFQFEMAVFGLSPADVELLVRAWQRALYKGLGTRRGRARLVSVQHYQGQRWNEVWQEAHSEWSPHLARLLQPAGVPDDLSTLTLRFMSPVRLQHRGRLCHPEQVTPPILLAALVRRLKLVAGAAMRPAPPTSDGLALSTEMRLYRWERQSSRQGRAIRLDGLVGDIHLTGDALKAWWPWLWLGQFTHLGKNVSHGLGQYQLVHGGEAGSPV